MSPKGLTAERIREEWNETDRHIALKSMVTVCMTGIAGRILFFGQLPVPLCEGEHLSCNALMTTIGSFAHPSAKLFFVLLAILTRKSMTGTSVSTPTVVASAAGDAVPNSAMAAATASSKKFDAPIIPAGAAIL